MASKAGITVAIKGEIDDLEAKISQSKEIINDATKSIISENNKLIASQEALNRIQKTYSKEIDNANNEIKKYLELKSQNGKLTKEEQQNLAAARAELALYKTKTKELTDVERERQKEIKRNIAITRDMQNLQRASINDARTEIETKRKVIELEKQSIASKNNLEKSTSNLANTTIRYLRWAGTIAGAVYAGKRAWDATIGSGIAVNKIIENNTYGIAALISANTQMVDSLGNTLTPLQKFVMGQEDAKKVLAELRKESVKTAATFPQLIEIFQQGIGKTLSMGDSFGATTEEIEKNTIKLSARMSNFANAIGMPMDRVKEEMRSLVSGNASTDSLISTIIFGSPGEANSAIREAEKKVNGVAELLDKKFKPFDILADTKTFDKSILSIQDAWSRAMGDMVDKSGMFRDITNLFYGMSEQIISNTDGIIKSFDSLYNSVKNIVSIFDDIAIAGAIFFIGSKLDKGLVSAARLVAGFGAAAGGATGLMLQLTLGVNALGLALKGLAMANPFTALAVAGTGLFTVFSAINDEIRKMQLNGKTVEEYEKQQKERLDKYNSSEEKFKRLEKTVNTLQLEKDGLEKAVIAYEKSGASTEKIHSKLEKVNTELFNYRVEYEKLQNELADKQTAKDQLTQTEQYGKLVTNIQIDIDRIKKDEKEILKTKGNIAEWESEITGYNKIKEESSKNLKKAEEAQAQAVKQSGKENLIISENIKNLKKDIANQDLLIALKQAKINEENQKDSDKTIRKSESELKRKTEINKKEAENKAVLLEIAAIQSGQIDEEKLKISLSELRIQSLEEEKKYLQDGYDKNKLILEIEKEKLNLRKLQSKEYKFDQVSGLIKYTDMQNLGEIYQELKVYYKEDPESLSDLEKWVEKEQNKLNKKPLTLQINLEGWDDISNSIATFGNSFQKIDKAQKKYQRENEKIIKDEVELEQARIDLVDTTISGYGDMIGAIGSFYDEDDERRKKQLELQKVFSAAKMAMQVAELAQSTAFTSLFVAQETTKGAAAGATAVAVAAQSSPWTGFITAAAMAALLASFGIMIGGKTKTTTVDMTMPVNDGKGSVLGDPMAQSESIANSLEILEDFASPQFRVLSEMNKNVKTIADSIGGVASLLIKQGGFAFGEGFTPYDTGWKNNISLSKGTVSGIGTAISAGTGASLGLGGVLAGVPGGGALLGGASSLMSGLGLNTAIGSAIGGALASTGIGLAIAGLDKLILGGALTKMLGGVVNKIAGGLFGKTSVSSTMTDSGIYFGNQLITDAINQMAGSAYQTIQTTVSKKSLFKKSSSTTIVDYFQALDGETNRQFSLVLRNLYDTVITAGTALDSAEKDTAKNLEKFVVSIGKISLKGKTGQQIQETLSAIFGRIGDDLAKTAFPLLVNFQQVGEGMFETLTRVATGMEEAEYYINRLGVSFKDIKYTDIINKQGNVGFEALLQSIAAVEEKLYPVNNGLLTIVSGLNATAEELYGMYLSLDNLREAFKFLKVDVQAVSYATIRGAGSLEALVSGVDSYIENFLTEEERLEYSITMLKKEFGKLNVEMPTSKKGFKDLLASLDLTTEAGQELYGRLIILSEGFSDVVDESEKVYSKTISRISNIQNAFLDMITLLDNTINALLGKQTGNTSTDATIANYLTKREQVDILLGKGSNISESELETLNGLVSELATMASTIQSGFDDNTNITTNLVKDLALIKSKLKYTNQFVETDIKEQEGNILKGFSTGGYTGNGATDEIKGYVHGNEWVVNSAQVNAIGGPDAVKNMVQKEIIQKNTKIQTTKLEYSNNKSDIIDKVMTGQDIIINGFNAILSKIDEIIDYNEERREQKHSVLVSGTVNIGG